MKSLAAAKRIETVAKRICPLALPIAFLLRIQRIVALGTRKARRLTRGFTLILLAVSSSHPLTHHCQTFFVFLDR